MGNRVIFQNFEPELIVAAPGRINLIGEHTDYNMGYVFPAAIDKRIEFRIRRNDDPLKCHVYSKDFDKILSFELDAVKPSNDEWENYILGVVYEIQKLGHALSGFDCQLTSNLPIGAGISSSAAMECGMAYALNALFELGMSELDMILASQRAEHNFVGTQCGIMDQYASVMGQSDQAILLDCREIAHEMIPLDLGEHTLLLLNTNVTHSLASSGYNDRKADCEDGVYRIKRAGLEIHSLRDLNEKDLENHKELLSPVVLKRCLYVVRENQRVLDAAKALKDGNLEKFGKLMYASHEGLQKDYEVSCPELDFLVEFSRNHKEILGSRMMGGGFGGCTINLIRKDFVQQYIQEVSEAYKNEFDIDLDPIEVWPSQGARVIN